MRKIRGEGGATALPTLVQTVIGLVLHRHHHHHRRLRVLAATNTEMLRWLSLQLLSWQQTTRKQKKKKKRRRSHSRLLNCPQVVPQLLLQEEEVWAEAPPTAANTWTGSSWSGAPWSWWAHLHLTGCCRSAGRKEVKGHISYKSRAGLIMAINRISCSRWPTPSLILAARSSPHVQLIKSFTYLEPAARVGAPPPQTSICSTHHFPVEPGHDVSGERVEALWRETGQKWVASCARDWRRRRRIGIRTHLLHVDIGLGACFQELDPVVDGELENQRERDYTQVEEMVEVTFKA